MWYTGGYAQDVWRLRSNVTLTAGLRLDVPMFDDTGYTNPNVDLLTFRDETGAAVQYQSGKLPDPKVLWSPRFGFNWDLASNQNTQVRGGTGVFTGKPAYVWISNQIGNTGMLTGFIEDQISRPTGRSIRIRISTSPPPSPAPRRPASILPSPIPTSSSRRRGAAMSASTRSLAGGSSAPPSSSTTRTSTASTTSTPTCRSRSRHLSAPTTVLAGLAPRAAPPRSARASTRLNNAAGNQITNAIVLKNQDVGRSWNFAASLMKTYEAGVTFKTAYSYGESRNTVDPGSIAAGSFTGNAISGNPNNAALAYSSNSPGHRFFIAGSYSKQYFGFGETTVSAYWETRTIGNASYVFSGDMNLDSASGNDLIYIHRDISEMNFSPFTAGTRTFTAAEQAAAWDAYIAQDPYLSKHRGQYAERGAVFLPQVKRMDLSVSQTIFGVLGGQRHSGQIRLDIVNFGNLLNSNWGVSQRLVQNQILTNGAVDAAGRATYRMAVVNGALPTTSYQSTSGIADVYTLMLSFRYNFN